MLHLELTYQIPHQINRALKYPTFHQAIGIELPAT